MPLHLLKDQLLECFASQGPPRQSDPAGAIHSPGVKVRSIRFFDLFGKETRESFPLLNRSPIRLSQSRFGCEVLPCCDKGVIKLTTLVMVNGAAGTVRISILGTLSSIATPKTTGTQAVG